MPAAFRIVEDLDIHLLITSSSTGETALFLSKSRTRALILGATDNDVAYRRMCLYWGVMPSLCVSRGGIPKDEFMVAAWAEALRLDLAVPGDQIAVVTGAPICMPATVANAVEVIKM